MQSEKRWKGKNQKTQRLLNNEAEQTIWNYPPPPLTTIPILRQQKDWVGLENGQFCWRSVLYLCRHSRWVGQKSPKLCWRNIGMVPNTPWKIGQCIMVRTDERWVLCYICMCKSIEGQSQIKIPSINLIRDQFSMNWASRNDYQASHIFFLFFLQGKRLLLKVR
jgi:hypothetical protein